MTFRKTACLASLLFSFPLAVPTLSVAADWQWGTTAETGTDSNNNVTFPQEGQTAATYGSVYIGYAKQDADGKADASNNTCTTNSGFSLDGDHRIEIGDRLYRDNELYGGFALLESSFDILDKDVTLTANNNKLFLKDGTFADTDYTPYILDITGGYCDVHSQFQKNYPKSATAKANGNEVYIGNANKEEVVKGVKISFTTDINGGYVWGRMCHESLEASGNTVTIYEGVTFDKDITVSIYAGHVENEGNSTDHAPGGGSVTASDNRLNMTVLTAISTNKIAVGYASYSGDHNINAVADGNKGKLVFGDNAQLAIKRFHTLYGWIAGGYAYSLTGAAQANSNELDITGGNIYGALVTGYAEGDGDVSANSNITTVTKIVHNGSNRTEYESTYWFSDYSLFAGGYAKGRLWSELSTLTANKNISTVTESKINYAYGGFADCLYGGRIAYTQSNELTITSSTVDYAYAGCSYAKRFIGATLYDPSTSNHEAYVSNNTLSMAGGSSTVATAGYAVSFNIAEATDNYVYLNYDPETETNLEAKTTINSALYGGYAEGNTAKATGNTGSLVNAVFSDDGGEFSGGMAVAKYNISNKNGGATASKNEFSITGGSLARAYGGQAVSSINKSTAAADENVLTLSGAEVRATLYGGYAASTVDSETDADADAVSGTASAKTNTLSLYGGTYGGDVYAGYASTSTASSTAESGGNTINLYALDGVSPSFADTTAIWGGYASQGGSEVASTGNTLTFTDVKGMTAANIKNFQNLNFEYENLAAGDIVLTLSGAKATATDTTATNDDATATTATDDASTTAAGEGTSVAGAEISVSISSLTGSGGGDFLPDDKVILLKNENGLDTTGIKTSLSVASKGVSLAYDVLMHTNEKELYLTCSGSRLLPETKVISEGAASGLALAGESANATMGLLRELTLAKGTITPFAHVQGSSMRYETGSSINVSAVSLVAGLGTGGIETGIGTVGVGAFFEYGKGSYTTHNSFDSRADVDGNGTSWYMGGGILAQMDFVKTGPGHFYVEGSAHMGNLHNEFDSDLADSKGNIAKLDMDTPYYSLHGGLGYVWDITEGHELDVYGKYIWTRVQGTDETLSTKDKYEFDDMDSNRVRLGARYTYTGSERFSPYVGLAFEHEFSGSCDAKVYDRSVAAPSFEGSSGMGELGIIMKPAEELPLSINLGVQGFVGQKQGVSGSCNVMYEF